MGASQSAERTALQILALIRGEPTPAGSQAIEVTLQQILVELPARLN